MVNNLLNKYLFFLIDEGKVICWDYKNHNQYELSKKNFEELLKISKNKALSLAKIDRNFIEEKLVGAFCEEDMWGWDILSKIFHLGTQIQKNNEGEAVLLENYSKKYLQLSENLLLDAPPLNIEKKGKKILLPKPDYSLLENYNLLTSLQKRKTCRSFNKSLIPLNVFSTLLSVVFEEIRNDEEEYKIYGYKQIGLRKSSPSGGGLHSTEAYVLILEVDNLKKGVYHYSKL